MMQSLGTLLLASFVVACSGSAPVPTPAVPAPTPPSAATVPPSVAPPTSDAIATVQPPPTPTATITAGSTSSGAAYLQLLALVPPAIANTCTEFDPTSFQALAVAICTPEFAVDPDHYVDDAWYFWFDADWKALDAWANEWERMGEPAFAECSEGPATNLYYVDGEAVGRIVCGPAPDGGGLAAWWYDDREIVVKVRLFEGTYEDLASLVSVVAAQP